MPSLLINVNNGDERLVPIVAESTVVGRDPMNEIVIDHPTVSRRHVELLLTDSEWFVRDLGSKNGSSLNGKKLSSEPVRLSHGSELRLGGDRVRASFLSDDETIPTAPALRSKTMSWFPRVGIDSESGERLLGVLRLTPWLRFAGAILGLTAATLSLIWWFSRIF